MPETLPPISIPRWITRQFISMHRRDLTFVFGTDYRNYSYTGQAAHCRGEPNCYPVWTKYKNCGDASQKAFFDDKMFELAVKPIIDQAIEKIPRDKPIICFPRIGEGGANMKEMCPRSYEYLMSELRKIEYPNIQWINP